MENKRPCYVYGPVPSRRLGRSLGIDLVPYKVCSYDCFYCQLGHTTLLTGERKEYVPIQAVLNDLDAAISRKKTIDCVTLAGSGEPTLNSGVGVLIREIKRRYSLPVAVITNGSLLWRPELREEMAPADFVLPSLDAGDEQMFKSVNRPHPSIDYEMMVDGLVRFAEEYEGEIRLEVMLLKYVNSTETELKKIVDRVNAIGPTRVQLNTVYRPPCEQYAFPMTERDLEKAASYFKRPVDIIRSESAPKPGDSSETPDDADILTMIERRPCTLEDISAGLETSSLEIVKRIEHLIGSKKLVERRTNGRVYFSAARAKKENTVAANSGNEKWSQG